MEGMSLGTCELCENISNNCSELEQLGITMTCLKNLMNWYALCLNNNKEAEEYKKLKQAYHLLEDVHKNYLKESESGKNE